MKTLAELTALKEKARELVALREGKDTVRVVVAMGTCGIAAGAKSVLNAFVEGISQNGLYEHVLVRQSGNADFCEQAPVVEVYEDGKDKVTYVKMTAEKAQRVITEHLIGGKPVAEFTK